MFKVQAYLEMLTIDDGALDGVTKRGEKKRPPGLLLFARVIAKDANELGVCFAASWDGGFALGTICLFLLTLEKKGIRSVLEAHF